MFLEIITPDNTVFAGEIELAQMPGTDGSFEVLKNHAPLISVLKKGKVKIIDNQKQTHYFEITGGIAEVKKNKIIILCG